MIDIIRRCFFVVELNEVLQNQNEVVLLESVILSFVRHFEVETSVDFVTCHRTHVVLLVIEEERFNEGLGVFRRGQIARADFFVNGFIRFVGSLGGIFFERHQNVVLDRIVDDILKKIEDFFVGVEAEYTKHRSDVNFSFSIDFHGDHTFFIGFNFEPGSAFGDDFGVVHSGRRRIL